MSSESIVRRHPYAGPPTGVLERAGARRPQGEPFAPVFEGLKARSAP